MQIPQVAERRQLDCDVLVVGGGTAGTMAALTAARNGASVLIMEKAHVRHSGALAMGMDGVNNAVVPGKATPRTTSPTSPSPTTASSTSARSTRPRPAGSKWCSAWSPTA
ncbi:hypothetical protein GCM10029992_07640 [Glycomyces albus]